MLKTIMVVHVHMALLDVIGILIMVENAMRAAAVLKMGLQSIALILLLIKELNHI
jgi:hypothetical protein